MLCKDTMRDNIVKAALERFLHYGYAKTTMAEIACDCNMSPGNLYRYFPGKLDIALAIAEKHGDELLVHLREIARDKTISNADKVRKFFSAYMHDTFDKLENDPRIYEIAQLISKEKPDFANGQIAKQRAMLTEILSAGNANGEFDVDDVVFTAEMMQSALLKFSYPQLWSKLSIEQLERELDGVLDIILAGISAKPVSQGEAAARSAAL